MYGLNDRLIATFLGLARCVELQTTETYGACDVVGRFCNQGYAIEATDGQLGTFSDFLFEDDSWIVRWLVVDTGDWLSGRKVLLPLSVFRKPDRALRQFPVKLTMKQVEDSPDIDSYRPVSRQLDHQCVASLF